MIPKLKILKSSKIIIPAAKQKPVKNNYPAVTVIFGKTPFGKSKCKFGLNDFVLAAFSIHGAHGPAVCLGVVAFSALVIWGVMLLWREQ